MVTDHFIKRLLIQAGIKPQRFDLEWASAAEAPLYVKLITKFTKEMKELGPLGEAEGMSPEQLKAKLAAAKAAAVSMKLRTQFAKFTQDLRAVNDYSAQSIETKMAEKLNEAIAREMEKPS